MKLDTIGKILTRAFGDRVLTGIITGVLDGVTPMRAYEYIEGNIQVLHGASEGDWQKFRRAVSGTNIDNVTSEDIIDELRKVRPDILGIIINTTGGREWLDRQAIEVKKKLLEQIP